MEGYGSDIGVSPRAISELLKQASINRACCSDSLLINRFLISDRSLRWKLAGRLH